MLLGVEEAWDYVITERNSKKMNEIKCPNCGKVFSVDEASYASVVSQVRNKEFTAEVQRRAEELERQQQLQRQSDKLQAEQGFQRQLNEKDKELERRNAEIARLEEQVKSASSHSTSLTATATDGTATPSRWWTPKRDLSLEYWPMKT